jgi:hypothetical protein
MSVPDAPSSTKPIDARAQRGQSHIKFAVWTPSRLGEGGSGRRSPGRDRGAWVAAAESSERSESSGARHSVTHVTNQDT